MATVDPALLRKYIMYSVKGLSMLHVQLSKALRRMVRGVLLFYKCRMNELEHIDFKVKSYDPYVANKMMNGTQMTMCWNDDALKTFHRDKEMVRAFAMDMDKISRPKTTITRRDVCDYIYMWTEQYFGTWPGTMVLSILKYLYL